jgi:surfactin synthase thioesterase subunit
MWYQRFPSSVHRKGRLVCFHHAGGNPHIFEPWTAWLGLSLDIISIELPGHGIRFEEELIPTAEEIACHLVPELLPFFDEPIFFLGHSMGAILAFETVRQLVQVEAKPDHLYLISAYPPHIRKKKISHKKDSSFLRDLQQLGGMHPELLKDVELMSFLLPILRNDFRLIEGYQQKTEKFDCPITVYGGVQDIILERDLARWQEMNPVHFSLQMFQGNHFFLHEDHQVFQTELHKSLYKQLHGKSRERFA